MSKKENYKIIKNIIPEELVNHLYNYITLKKKVTARLIKDTFIADFDTHYGTFGDFQCPNAYSHYADIAMETLLLDLLPVMEKHTDKKLIPNYSYTRIYTKGDELKRHKDRHECEISTTLNLGGDPWPIYILESAKEGQRVTPGKNKDYIPSKKEGKKIVLKPGDMLIYKGYLFEHYRKKFTGDTCVQVFLHYNNVEYKHKNKYDSRPFIGLPDWFKGRK
jgi:hypothetical protein